VYPHLETNLIAHQRRMLHDWEREAKPVGNMIFGRSIGGTRVPLFWVMQSVIEASRMAKALGPEQPLYAMRSGHLIVGRFDSGIVELAETYVQSITDCYPTGPVILGGNCQGADVAKEMCHIFEKRGRSVTLLIVVDPSFRDHPGARAAAIFGAQSHCNPFRSDLDNTSAGAWLTEDDITDVLPCGHGQYFSSLILPQLAEKIGRLIEGVTASLARSEER
jgi:thioesterase domain-containing protein